MRSAQGAGGLGYGWSAGTIGEFDRNEANPFYYLNLEMTNRLFYKYPSRKNPLGSRQTVSAATTDMMKLIQGRYYVPNNTALIVTGCPPSCRMLGQSMRWMETPRPLVRVVAPPSREGTMWSVWRIGASQYGVRQVSSRSAMNAATVSPT